MLLPFRLGDIRIGQQLSMVVIIRLVNAMLYPPPTILCTIDSRSHHFELFVAKNGGQYLCALFDPFREDRNNSTFSRQSALK